MNFEEHTDSQELCLFGITTSELYHFVYMPIIDTMNTKYLEEAEVAELWYGAAEKTYEAYKAERCPIHYGMLTTTNEYTLLQTASFLCDYYKDHVKRRRHN